MTLVGGCTVFELTELVKVPDSSISGTKIWTSLDHFCLFVCAYKNFMYI